MFKNLNLILILLLFYNNSFILSYGESLNTHPNWLERETLVMINSLRMEPNYYKRYFMKPFNFTNLEQVITPKYYEKVDPIQYNLVLNQMSRSHSTDMSLNECFTFDNCNYTSFYQRIESWKCDENTQEHIYKTSSSNNGFKAVNRLVCRNSQNCLKDDDPDVGDFRDRIMGKQINHSGTGIVYNSTLKTWFYTMDFTEDSCTPESKDDKSIISASHTFKYDQDKEVLFLANFFNSNESIQSFRIYLNNMNYKMNLLYSSDNSKSSNGVYSYNTRIYNKCDYYYFKVITHSNKQIRYPTNGYLRIVDYQEKCNSWSPDLKNDKSFQLFLKEDQMFNDNNSNTDNDNDLISNNLSLKIFFNNYFYILILFISFILI